MRRSYAAVAVLALAALAFGPFASRVDDEPVLPQQLVPALDFYVDSLLKARDEVVACGPAEMRDDPSWAQAKAILLATVWANGLPRDFAAGLAARLDRPARTDGIDCKSPDVFYDIS